MNCQVAVKKSMNKIFKHNTTPNSQQITADIIIIGGGIAGLWALNHLRNKGYNAILLESNALGINQTLKSQGIIHGGLKYALNGLLSKETELISSMPKIWEECLNGSGSVNLKGCKLLSKHQYLWSNGSLATRLSSFFASKLIKSRIEKVKRKDLDYPKVFQNKAFKGSVYKLNEIVLDMKTVVEKLANNYKEYIIQIEKVIKWDETNHNDAENNNKNINKVNRKNEENLKVSINNMPVTIKAKSVVLTAGENNFALSSLKKNYSPKKMQLRPLHMVYLKNKNLEKLYAHCVGTSLLPTITISTHYDNKGNMVWYVGGKVAEDGINRNEEEQIKAAKLELAKLFPWLDFSNASFGTFFVNRAEAKQANGKKPENATCFKQGNVLTAWPTKLALAPILAEQIENYLNELEIFPVNNQTKNNTENSTHNKTDNLTNNLTNSLMNKYPGAKVGLYPWDNAKKNDVKNINIKNQSVKNTVQSSNANANADTNLHLSLNSTQDSNFYRAIGNTGIKVSVLGLGTVKIGRNEGVKYPQAFSIPDDMAVKNLFSQAYDLGINLIDTAPAYGTSEKRIGKLLHKERSKWIICSKAGENFVNGKSSFDFSRNGIIESVKRSLSNLKTDYLDLLLIHSNGMDMQIINDYEVFNTLDYLKQEGVIRASGMSTKTVEGGISTVEHSDVAMITFNPIYKDEYPIIKKASESNKGIFIKKALASGHLDKIENIINADDKNSIKNPAQYAFNFILKEKSVSSIIIGTINPKHLEENVSAVRGLD